MKDLRSSGCLVLKRYITSRILIPIAGSNARIGVPSPSRRGVSRRGHGRLHALCAIMWSGGTNARDLGVVTDFQTCWVASPPSQEERQLWVLRVVKGERRQL